MYGICGFFLMFHIGSCRMFLMYRLSGLFRLSKMGKQVRQLILAANLFAQTNMWEHFVSIYSIMTTSELGFVVLTYSASTPDGD